MLCSIRNIVLFLSNSEWHITFIKQLEWYLNIVH